MGILHEPRRGGTAPLVGHRARGYAPAARREPANRPGKPDALGATDEVQNVPSGPAAEAVEALGVSVDRKAALGLAVEGAGALADPAPSAEPHARGLDGNAQGMPAL